MLNAFLAYIRRSDATDMGDSLWKWLAKTFQLGIKLSDLIEPEGCMHLDGLIASEMMDRRQYSGRPHMSFPFSRVSGLRRDVPAGGNSTMWPMNIEHVSLQLPHGCCYWRHAK